MYFRTITCLSVITLTFLVAYGASPDSTGYPKESPVPVEKMRELLRKGNLFEFAFSMNEGRSDTLKKMHASIGHEGGGYAIHDETQIEGSIAVPPLFKCNSHACNAQIIAHDGEQLEVVFSFSRTVGINATEDSATWETQNQTVTRQMSIGVPTTLTIPAHIESGMPAIEVALTIQPLRAELR